MKKLKSLNLYQKAILGIMLAMILIFAVLYPIRISRVGYRFNDAILIQTSEDGNTLYSGKIGRQPACFTVSADTVTFQCGDKTYGPYTMTIDPSAVPKDLEYKNHMTGIEIFDNKQSMFRGGVMDLGDHYWLNSEDGSYDNMVGYTFGTSTGLELDADGNPVDQTKPTPAIIYELLTGPRLTHKGEALGWFAATFICLLNALTILFADSIFRWNLAFHIRNTDRAEPSDWEIARRYIGWTLLPIIALALFLMGLR